VTLSPLAVRLGRSGPRHLRHASLTNGAAAGETPIALMTRAGHANMSTTQTYLHLAGVVFPDEAQRLEDRFGAGLRSRLDLREEVAQVVGDVSVREKEREERIEGPTPQAFETTIGGDLDSTTAAIARSRLELPGASRLEDVRVDDDPFQPSNL
jgi:hypothetical protein